MTRREFLQLAKVYKPDKQDIAGWYISEKLDGTRCLWDGGITRGMKTTDVPWASVTDPKTGGRKKKLKPIATGLWSRYGNPIIAPDWFLDSLPESPLDGELWAGRGKFQLCRSICAGDDPDPRFDRIKFMVYGVPPPGLLFADGEIKNANFICNIDAATRKWFDGHLLPGMISLIKSTTFTEEYRWLKDILYGNKVAEAHKQVELPQREDDARETIEGFLSDVLRRSGEGVIIRDPLAHYAPKRVNALLKYKPELDCEATITGFTSGRKTSKGSKHLGRIGALITDYKGKRLELAGLTDEERMFRTAEMETYATAHPGVDMPDWFRGLKFKVGQVVTLCYTELTDAGLPKSARYFRKRDVE